jgi:mRNA interferase MazF
VVPLTSRADRLVEGEFSLAEWQNAGLNMASVVKRGLFTVHESFILKRLGTLGAIDTNQVNESLRSWLVL